MVDVCEVEVCTAELDEWLRMLCGSEMVLVAEGMINSLDIFHSVYKTFNKSINQKNLCDLDTAQI